MTPILYLLVTVFLSNGEIFTYEKLLELDACNAKAAETGKLIDEAGESVGPYKIYCLPVPTETGDQL